MNAAGSTVIAEAMDPASFGGSSSLRETMFVHASGCACIAVFTTSSPWLGISVWFWWWWSQLLASCSRLIGFRDFMYQPVEAV